MGAAGKVDGSGRVMSLPQALAHRIRLLMERGGLCFGDRLLSVNRAAVEYGVARDTVEKAYRILRSEGLVRSIAGKGVFVERVPDGRVRVLLLFNKLSAYKKLVYDGIVSGLSGAASVDLCIFHYDPGIFSELLDRHLGGYHYFVVMPHFFEGVDGDVVRGLLSRVPAEQLVLLDKRVSGVDCLGAVYQDFFMDICQGLSSIREVLGRYGSLEFVFPSGRHHPREIIDGVRLYCELDSKDFSVVGSVGELSLVVGRVYLVLLEQHLAELILAARAAGMVLGRDIGVISFNETVLKQVLEITVVSTDFVAMGESVARMILGVDVGHWRNPHRVVLRGSV